MLRIKLFKKKMNRKSKAANMSDASTSETRRVANRVLVANATSKAESKERETAEWKEKALDRQRVIVLLKQEKEVSLINNSLKMFYL